MRICAYTSICEEDAGASGVLAGEVSGARLSSVASSSSVPSGSSLTVAAKKPDDVPEGEMTFDEAFGLLPGNGWLTVGEARELWDAARIHRAAQVLELGTYYGRSAALLAMAITEDAHSNLVLCDPYDDGHHFHGRDTPDAIFAQRAVQDAVYNAGMSGRCSVAIMGEKELFAKWHPGRRLDLVYVDGDHTFDGTFGAIDRWTQRTTPGGLMLCHDWAMDGGGVEIKRAIEVATDNGWLRMLRVTGRMAVCQVTRK